MFIRAFRLNGPCRLIYLVIRAHIRLLLRDDPAIG